MSQAVSELTPKPGAGSKEMKTGILEQTMNNPKVNLAESMFCALALAVAILTMTLILLSMPST
jgi:hypothetical protein